MCIFEFIFKLTKRNVIAKSSSHVQIETKQTKTIYFGEIAIFPTCKLYLKIKWPFSVCEKKTDGFHVGLLDPIIFYTC